MKAEVNSWGELVVSCEEYDLCQTCKNSKRCPLIQAISQEIVILHYSPIGVGECGLYIKGKQNEQN
jgi:hypothetical protein